MGLGRRKVSALRTLPAPVLSVVSWRTGYPTRHMPGTQWASHQNCPIKSYKRFCFLTLTLSVILITEKHRYKSTAVNTVTSRGGEAQGVAALQRRAIQRPPRVERPYLKMRLLCRQFWRLLSTCRVYCKRLIGCSIGRGSCELGEVHLQNILPFFCFALVLFRCFVKT